jgi:hypothetical protein
VHADKLCHGKKRVHVPWQYGRRGEHHIRKRSRHQNIPNSVFRRVESTLGSTYEENLKS